MGERVGPVLGPAFVRRGCRGMRNVSQLGHREECRLAEPEAPCGLRVDLVARAHIIVLTDAGGGWVISSFLADALPRAAA